ncbi:sortase [Clavibacter sp. VKM Ac-2872]|uniref:sortase n=1 Tax=Clavibacter sp. VKM Ac-2872 TaxID=2783812 RepID=UPI001E3285B5|nr:sortase [Clavibacter sp. VKM Ac-2872]
MLAKTLAGAFVALAITVSVPLAAQAENYVPTDSAIACSGMSVTPAAVAPGGSVRIAGVAGSFTAGETVAVRLSATAGVPAAAGDPAASVTAAADGSVAGTLVVPTTASATWRANQTVASGDHWCGLVSVVPASARTAADSGSLPITGGTLPTGLALTGGGLLLAGAAAAGIATVRRRRAA